jgi:hypothetical protein
MKVTLLQHKVLFFFKVTQKIVASFLALTMHCKSNPDNSYLTQGI